MSFDLMPLPYSKSALEPAVSSRTLEFHYEKHHRGYVDKTNMLMKDTALESLSLEQVMLQSDGDLFNNAAQVWNHNFFWNSLTPEASDQKVSSELALRIARSFGSVETFKTEFVRKGLSHFGSGYLWLLADDSGVFELVCLHDAMTPLKSAPSKTPILTCDLWEHSYYLDYQNDRRKYLEAIFDLLNWRFADEQ